MLDDILKELENVGADLDKLFKKAEQAIEPECERIKEKYKNSDAEKLVNSAKNELQKLADEFKKIFE